MHVYITFVSIHRILQSHGESARKREEGREGGGKEAGREGGRERERGGRVHISYILTLI